jgi:hypothetical protein
MVFQILNSNVIPLRPSVCTPSYRQRDPRCRTRDRFAACEPAQSYLLDPDVTTKQHCSYASSLFGTKAEQSQRRERLFQASFRVRTASGWQVYIDKLNKNTMQLIHFVCHCLYIQDCCSNLLQCVSWNSSPNSAMQCSFHWALPFSGQP